MNARFLLALTAVSLLSGSLARAGDDVQELRRILTLSNGQTLRAVTRFSGDHWQYKNLKGWQDLLPGFVARAVGESEALAQYAALSKGVAKQDLDARVAVARQGLTLGLTKEALDELDGVLALDPDHRAAIGSLQRGDLMKLPAPAGGADEAGAREALLRFAAPLTAAPREIAIHALAQTSDKPALQDALTKDLGSNIVVRRSFAAHALRRLYPGLAGKSLLLHSVYDPSQDVRLACAQAIKLSGEEAWIVPLVRTVEDASSSLARANAAEALGVIGNAAAVEPLVARLATPAQATSSGRIPHSHIFVGQQRAYVQDFDVEVAQFQAVSDPIVNVVLEGMVTEAAVSGVAEAQYEVENATIRKSLQRLTGARPGSTNRAWIAWWKQNGERWRQGLVPAPATRTEG